MNFSAFVKVLGLTKYCRCRSGLKLFALRAVGGGGVIFTHCHKTQCLNLPQLESCRAEVALVWWTTVAVVIREIGWKGKAGWTALCYCRSDRILTISYMRTSFVVVVVNWYAWNQAEMRIPLIWAKR